ncbi:hypothetical protein ES705_50668 [subsurface metagenome]
MKSKFDHHSVINWDFNYGVLHRSLSATRYISAPTSLKLMNTGAGTIEHDILCRLDTTLNLAQGEARTWRWATYTGTDLFLFRNQAALGSANKLNSYIIHRAGNNHYLDRYIAGVYERIGYWVSPSIAQTWEHWRVVWWNGVDGGGNPALAVDFYQEVDSAWVKKGATVYDIDNQWSDSDINRCGLLGLSASFNPWWFDDTEIWGPV